MSTAGQIAMIDEEGAHMVALYGEHDLSTAQDIERALDDAFGRGSTVILDLTEAEFVDSSVFGQIILATRRAASAPEHRFAVAVKPGWFIDRMVELAGLEQATPIFPTRREAITAITAIS